MSPDLSRFYIALPGCQQRLPNFRYKVKSEEALRNALPSYLRDLPCLPDFLTHISGYRDLTLAERHCLDRHIKRLAQLVREARERWRDENGITDEELEAAGVL